MSAAWAIQGSQQRSAVNSAYAVRPALKHEPIPVVKLSHLYGEAISRRAMTATIKRSDSVIWLGLVRATLSETNSMPTTRRLYALS